MAKIEVGKEYKNCLGKTVQIVAQSKNKCGESIFLGVLKEDTNPLTGMSCYYYQDDGKAILMHSPQYNLVVFDWRELKKDDVVWVKTPSYETSWKKVARHVYYADIERELIFYYGDGVSSLTYDRVYHVVLNCTPSSIVGLVSPKS